MAQMLCFMCGEMIYGAGGAEAAKVFSLSPALSAWWDRHYMNDCNRVVIEMKQFIRERQKAEGSIPDQEWTVNAFIVKAEAVHAVSRFHKEIFFPACYGMAIGGIEREAKDGKG